MKWKYSPSSYRYSISCSSSAARSTLSSELKRCSTMVPDLKLRILTCTKPRRLPGVRCSILKIENKSLFHLITMPGRSCVAEIIKGNLQCIMWLKRMKSLLALISALVLSAQTPDAPKKKVYSQGQRNFWSFKAIKDPVIASPSPIDAFILAKLDEKKLKPAKPASKIALIRRATFDLTGLPPTEPEIEAFLADQSPNSFATVIDRLLASPRYGEKWGRHWLDVARYADSTGADEDHRYPYAWRYRDYVIDAFNNDLPYDQFVREQVAGDLLPAPDGSPVNARGIIATGFLSIGPRLIAEQDKPKMLYDFIDEQIDTTTRGILGLTVACARCHDHKFDPIATADYYSLAAIFANTKSFSKIGTGGVSEIYYAPLAPPDVVLKWVEQQAKVATLRRQANAMVDIEIERRQAPLRGRIAEYMMATR